jgi:hypothetical protein
MSDNLLKACGLWERTSAKGNTYLVGRWGGVKILVMPNRDRQGDNEPSHHLLIAEAPDRAPQVRQKAEDTQKPPAPPSRRGRRQRPPAATGQADGQPFHDDDVPW